MSHFSTIKSNNKITNPELLAESLQELGWNGVIYHLEAQPMQDYYQVRGEKSESQSEANVIVPWQQNKRRCNSDFGFLKQDGEYVLIADEMDTRSLQNRIQELQKLYNQKTAAAMEANVVATAQALNKGTPIVERTEVDGKIQLKIAFSNDIRQHNRLQQQTIRR